ncbi:MAG: NUDIX hydrolase [bacterium]|nr:NUDIX hydrolase [bacterium]
MTKKYEVLGKRTGQFGAFSLVEQDVRIIDSGKEETWFSVERREKIVRLLLTTDKGYWFLERPSGLRFDAEGWQLPTIYAVNGSVTDAAEEFLRESWSVEGDIEYIGESPVAATVSNNIHFVAVRLSHFGRSLEGLKRFAPRELFDLLRRQGIQDDRSARMIYDHLPISLVADPRIANSWSDYDASPPAFADALELADKVVDTFGFFRLIESTTKDIRPSESAIRQVVERPDGVRILALDDQGRIVITRELRNDGWDWRLPGGKVKRIDPLATARGELKDETGYTARNMHLIRTSLDDEDIRYRLHYYLAEGLTPGEPRRHGAEVIEVHLLQLPAIFAHLRSTFSEERLREDRTGGVLYSILPLCLVRD